MKVRKSWAVLAAAIAATGCVPASQGPDTVVEPRSFSGDAPRGSALLRSAMVEGHNRARQDVGMAPLRWDQTLAADAQRYADELARTGRYRHSEAQTRGNEPEGENLFRGTRGAYRYSEMVQLWIDEKRYFKRGITPDFSTTGNWRDVSHYTQIVWWNTRRFGCGFASSRTSDYLVCRYAPPGNVVGEDVFGGR
ncbi:CAP domain-containing protein [Stakelama marina]|nr:CAP domain-containing protein [Stakelama marina]